MPWVFVHPLNWTIPQCISLPPFIGASESSEEFILTFLLLNTTCPVLANSTEEANWSGSALFVFQYVNLYQQPGSGNLIGWKLEVGMAS